MWRSLFLAVGIFTIMLGIGFLGIDRVTLRFHEEAPRPRRSVSPMPRKKGRRCRLCLPHGGPGPSSPLGPSSASIPSPSPAHPGEGISLSRFVPRPGHGR